MNYANTIAEAAWITVTTTNPRTHNGAGICDQYGGHPGEPHWNAYVTISTNHLTEHGHADLAARLTNTHHITVCDAWIATSDDMVRLVDWAHDHGPRSGTDILWDRWLTNTPVSH